MSWNDENTKVVVLDGQHRAMALLAIERTLRGTWEQEARSARWYRHFYETRVRAALDAAGEASVEMLQVPVTLCWFPDQAGQQGTAHMAARKLFVDQPQRPAAEPGPARAAVGQRPRQRVHASRSG